MLEDVVYYVEPVNAGDVFLTSVHYVIAADSLRAPNSSCGELYTVMSRPNSSATVLCGRPRLLIDADLQ